VIRRITILAALTGAWVVATATPALAHGLGGRVDLPVPRWLFVFGAGTALIVSFVALSALWTEPKFERRPADPASATMLQRVLTSRVLEWVIRLVALAIFVVVTIASFRRVSPTETIGPILVFAWFWVGLTFAQALFGNLWSTLSPFDTIGRLASLDYRYESPPRAYPKAWGRWPAAILLLGFVWVELVDPFADSPGSLGLAILAYALITLAGMSVFGRKAWTRNGEAFAVYFGLIARLSQLARDTEGRVILRPPLAGLAEVEPAPGLLALIMVALGSTTFDGLSRTNLWVSNTASLTGIGRVAVFTAGLLGVIGLVAAAYSLAMAAAARVVGGRWHALAVRFAASLVPIVLAYVVAHYFSFLLIEGQLGIVNASDPFDLGWDLFGTAGWSVNIALLSATLIWYVQVAAIVIGHVGGVVLAHDRAIALFDRASAVRTQYALLAVMVLFTASGLLILSG
jgi:hypothetical protein